MACVHHHSIMQSSLITIFVFNTNYFTVTQGFPGGSVVQNLPANAGVVGVASSIPGSERPLGGGHGNPLQYSCVLAWGTPWTEKPGGLQFSG